MKDVHDKGIIEELVKKYKAWCDLLQIYYFELVL